MNTSLPQATQDLIQEYLEGTPHYLQETLERMDWTGELARIGAKHRLGHEQITNLTVETAMTLFGISEPQLFSNNVINHLGVSVTIAQSITRDVAERIFERMQELIHDGYGDIIMTLQQELTQAEAEADPTNSVFQEIGIEIGNDEVSLVGTDDQKIPSGPSRGDNISRSSLADKKISDSFSLDIISPDQVHYPEHDPYHEDLLGDTASASLVQPVRTTTYTSCCASSH